MVVRTVKETPPAELLRCRPRPEGLPAQGEATIPAAMRAAVMRLAKEFGATADQLDRLIAWQTGQECGT